MDKPKKQSPEKSALERVPTRKLFAMVKKDIKRTLRASASAAKPKKK
jgi:hypothetical protein